MGVNVCLLDNNELFCDGLGKLLQEVPDMIVGCMCRRLPEFLAFARRGEVDVVITEASFPEIAKAISNIHKTKPEASIIVIDNLELTNLLHCILCLRVSACLSSNIALEDLVHVIHLVNAGFSIMDEDVMESLSNRFRLLCPSYTTMTGEVTGEVVNRKEREVLSFIAEGCTNKEIATKLFISVNTVRVHMRNIMRKMKVNNRVQAAFCAIQRGLIE